MKAISLKQPYASLWAWRLKINETRSRAINYVGNIWIHASATKYADDRERCKWEPFYSNLKKMGYHSYDDMPFGMIVGNVDMIACAKVELIKGVPWLKIGKNTLPMPGSVEQAFGNYEIGRSIILAENHTPLPNPLPAKGTIFPLVWDLPVEKMVDIIMGEVKK